MRNEFNGATYKNFDPVKILGKAIQYLLKMEDNISNILIENIKDTI